MTWDRESRIEEMQLKAAADLRKEIDDDDFAAKLKDAKQHIRELEAANHRLMDLIYTSDQTYRVYRMGEERDELLKQVAGLRDRVKRLEGKG